MRYFIYWLAQLTWGAISSVIGAIVAAFFILIGAKPELKNGIVAFDCKEFFNNGSFSIGPFIFLSCDSRHTFEHEFGHSVQNMIFGPAMIFILLASVIRFWYREYYRTHNYEKYCEMPGYYDIWFEGQASAWGREYLNRVFPE